MMLYSKAAALIAVVVMPSVATAADRSADRVLAPFAACRALPDPAQRGLCYDQAYDGLRAGLASGDVVISDAEHRRAAFGLRGATPQSGPAKSGAPVPMGANEIDSTIVATRPYGPDMFVFQLADGGVWRMAEAGPDPQFPRGLKVHLKRVLMGGILLQPEHGREFKVIRVR